MKDILAKMLFTVSAIVFVAATFFMLRHRDPFYTHYFLFAWWSGIGIADSLLYRKGGESVLLSRIVEFITFLVPLSALVWFIFEAINLRIQNWAYVGVPWKAWTRWPGYFFSFGTVLPGIFLAAAWLEQLNVFPKNEFSHFFESEIRKPVIAALVAAGILMLALPLLWPIYFFPLVWGGFVLLLDPINLAWGGRSLILEWTQKNWNRTIQLLLAGFICGGFWELWNFWAGAKWIYTVPLPEVLLRNLKIFEMPVLGFLGFPPFALECFVMTEFARNVRQRLPRTAYRLLVLACFLFALFMCHMIDLRTVRSFR